MLSVLMFFFDGMEKVDSTEPIWEIFMLCMLFRVSFLLPERKNAWILYSNLFFKYLYFLFGPG